MCLCCGGRELQYIIHGQHKWKIHRENESIYPVSEKRQQPIKPSITQRKNWTHNKHQATRRIATVTHTTERETLQDLKIHKIPFCINKRKDIQYILVSTSWKRVFLSRHTHTYTRNPHSRMHESESTIFFIYYW